MPGLISAKGYLDADVAYLLGLIAARGQFYVEGDIRRLVIDFPYRLFIAKPPESSKLQYDIRTQMRLCLDDVRNRVSELLEVNVNIVPSTYKTQLVAVFTKNTMSWRNLTLLFDQRRSYLEFDLPSILFNVPRQIQLEFVRGFADASATPPRSDYEQFGREGPKLQRIVLQINQTNWQLPVQVCRLLQVNLQIPVQHILWGHPNLRDPASRASNGRRSTAFGFMPMNFCPWVFIFLSNNEF